MYALPQTFNKIISKNSLAPKPYSAEVNVVYNHVHISAIIAIKSETFNKLSKKILKCIRYPSPQVPPHSTPVYCIYVYLDHCQPTSIPKGVFKYMPNISQVVCSFVCFVCFFLNTNQF